MQISQVFPRRYATADDIGTQTPTLPIARVVMEKVGPAQKPVAYFFQARKGIVLNATLARCIAEIHGDDTDGWTGKKITLYTVPCRRMDGTRGLSIRARAPQAQQEPAQDAPQARPTEDKPYTALRNPARIVATA